MRGNNNCGPCDDIEFEREARHKIKLKLTEIQNNTDLTSIGLQFERKDMDESVLSVAEEKANVYENVSTLGIYVTNNYRFFSKLIVQSAFRCPFYDETMQKLGYRSEGGLWFLKSKPDEDVVIDFIFQFLFYSYVVQSKTANKDLKIGTVKLNLSEAETKPLTYSIDKGQSSMINEYSFNTYPNAQNSEICLICGTCQWEPKQKVDNEVINDNFEKGGKTPKEGVSYSDGNYLTSKRDTEASETGNIYMEVRKAEKINVNNAVINDDLDDEKKEILKGALYENDMKIEEKERSLESLENTSKNTWECKICTRVNDESVDHCEACFMMRCEVALVEERDIIDIGEPDERWLCKKCKTLNEVDVVKCSQCSSLADFINKWKCEKCTFYNYALAIFCKACYYKNPHLAKCSQCRIGTINIQLGATLCLLCAYRKEKEKNDRIRLFERKQKEKETKDKLPLSIYQDYLVIDNENKKKLDGTLQSRPLDDSELVDQKRHGKYDVKAKQFNFERNEKVGQNKIDEDKVECPICGKCFDNRESRWCQTCEENQWRCPDKDCRRINFWFIKYCAKCGIEKGSDLSNGHCFRKLINNTRIGLFKCEHCHKCNDWKRDKCVYCKRPRQLKIQCRKCHLLHDPSEPCKNKIVTLGK